MAGDDDPGGAISLQPVGYRNKIAAPETGYVDPISDNAAPWSALSSILFCAASWAC
jgi:hypothetical protein